MPVLHQIWAWPKQVSEWSLRRCYLAVATPVVFILCFLTPPFQAPDGFSHFFRSVQVSRAGIRPVAHPTRPMLLGSYIETDVIQIIVPFMDIPGHPERKASLAQIRQSMSYQRQGPLYFAEHRNTALYFPLAHAPAAAAIAVADRLNMRPLIWLYAGRLVNSFVALSLVAYALRHLRIAALPFFLIATLPMTMFLAASLAPDAVLVGAGMVLAIGLAELMETGDIARPRLLATLAAAFYLAVCKIMYLPLAAIPLVCLFAVHRTTKSLTLPVVAVSISVTVWGIWTSIIGSTVYPVRTDVVIDVYGQLRRVLTDPLEFIRTLQRTWLVKNEFYLHSMIGQLGWLDTDLPKVFLVATSILLVLCAPIEPRIKCRRPIVTFLVCAILLATCFGMFLVIYMQHSELGAPIVEGIQGRYFLPLLPLFVACLPRYAVGERAYTAVKVAVTCWVMLGGAVTVFCVWQRYWSP